jgi:diaminopimelate decarboxylase
MDFNVKEFAKKHSVPFYLFDEQLFLDNMDRLSTTFQSVYPDYHVAYSFKTNYTPYICQLVKENGGYAEVVSDMEYALARKLGYVNKMIIYNGPFKGALLEEHLLAGGIVNADNYNECERICALAESHPEKDFKIGLRLNLDLGAGFISRFGMVEDSEDMLRSVELIKKHRNLHVVGMHCHIKAPRDPEAWNRRSKIMIAAADKYVEGIPEYISLGSGMVPGEYSQYADDFENYKPTYQEFADKMFAPFIEHYPADKRPIVFTEPGRALITRYIRFFAKVDNFKEVRGRKLATTNGSFHNIGEIYSQARIPIIVHHNSEGKYYDKIDIMGYTCLEQDVMFPAYEGKLAVGDYIEFRNVGGYSIVYKPQFIYPQCPMYTLHHDGKTDLIMRQETVDDVLVKFI